jgi:anti-anti-sigma factor
MRPGELVVESRRIGARHTVLMRGELDLGTAADLEVAILSLCDGGATEIVLDLSELGFVDSAGLRAIVGARAICEEHDCSLQLTHPRAQVKRLFELTGLLDRLSFRRSSSATRRSQSQAMPGGAV